MRVRMWKIGLLISMMWCSSMGTVEAKPQLTWEEHFNRKQINQQKWQVLEEKPYKNKELQIYAKKNIVVKNGRLFIQSERRNGKYYSGAMQVKAGYAIRYGRIDIRAKLPVGKGVFPAIWMLPVANRALPEIDIMEMVGDKPNEIWQVYHFLDQKGKQQRTFARHVGENLSKTFQTYSLIWRPNELTWLLNGKVLHRTPQAPNVSMRIILNVAIGGNWPGSPDHTTNFPQYMEVDWIKVYNER
ncbi:MAG: hypothetical protein RLZZ267_251 [Bacillota bacterium]